MANTIIINHIRNIDFFIATRIAEHGLLGDPHRVFRGPVEIVIVCYYFLGPLPYHKVRIDQVASKRNQ